MTLEQILPLLSTLDTNDKLRLIDVLARQLIQERGQAERWSARSLKGALKHFGPSPSLEEFGEARREMWGR